MVAYNGYGSVDPSGTGSSYSTCSASAGGFSSGSTGFVPSSSTSPNGQLLGCNNGVSAGSGSFQYSGGAAASPGSGGGGVSPQLMMMAACYGTNGTRNSALDTSKSIGASDS